MRTLIITVILVACACDQKTEQAEQVKQDEPANPAMPSGYGYLNLGESQEEILKAAHLSPEDGKKPTTRFWSAMDRVYRKELPDDVRFAHFEVGMKADRLAGAILVVKLSLSEERYFHGMINALNKKLNCKADMYGPGTWFQGTQTPATVHRASFADCVSKESLITTMELRQTKVRGIGVIALVYHTTQSEDWVPEGTHIDM